MIEKIELSGNKHYKITESVRKYATKRIGKLDRYLPKNVKKTVTAKLVVAEVNQTHNNKYDLTATLEIPKGKVFVAKDQCSNVFAGIDILETKLKGQINRYKIENSFHLSRKSLKNLFIKRV